MSESLYSSICKEIHENQANMAFHFNSNNQNLIRNYKLVGFVKRAIIRMWLVDSKFPAFKRICRQMLSESN